MFQDTNTWTWLLTTWNLLVPNIIAHTPPNWGSWTHEPLINQESQIIQFQYHVIREKLKDGLINVEYILISQKFVNFFFNFFFLTTFKKKTYWGSNYKTFAKKKIIKCNKKKPKIYISRKKISFYIFLSSISTLKT